MLFNRDNQLSGNGNSGDFDAHQASARIDQWLAARPPHDQSHESIFEALRVQMQKIEDKWRGRSPLAAQIMDEIGSSQSAEDMLRHLTRLEAHIRMIEGKGDTSAPGTARPRRVVRTLIRL